MVTVTCIKNKGFTFFKVLLKPALAQALKNDDRIGINLNNKQYNMPPQFKNKSCEE